MTTLPVTPGNHKLCLKHTEALRDAKVGKPLPIILGLTRCAQDVASIQTNKRMCQSNPTNGMWNCTLIPFHPPILNRVSDGQACLLAMMECPVQERASTMKFCVWHFQLIKKYQRGSHSSAKWSLHAHKMRRAAKKE